MNNFQNQPYNNNQQKKKGSGISSLIVIVVFLISLVSKSLGSDSGIGFIFFLLIAAIFILPIIIIIATTKKNRKNADGSVAMTDSQGHLCDDGAHTGAIKERGYFDALDEMEHGYKKSANYTYVPTVIKMKRLTPEQLSRKREELSDLLSAGIISHEEYSYKLEQYRQ